MLGYKHTEESLIKMSVTHQGNIHSVESKAKISYATSGEKHPMFGRTGEKILLVKKSIFIHLT